MGGKSYSLDQSLASLLGVTEISDGDVLELRHIIEGGSIVDWPRLYFTSSGQVDEFLRSCEYDPENRLHVERLSDIHRGAVEYMRAALGIDVPADLVRPQKPQDIFLAASVPGPQRSPACMILKVMHVIHHLEARELLYHLPVSERQLFSRVEKRVSATVADMQELGFPIDNYQASQKTKDSLITKLLSKRKDTAAQVFPRIRFRIITSQRKGILQVMFYLKRHLLPFPYVIPGESANTLASEHCLFQEAFGIDLPQAEGLTWPVSNPFSHRNFRVVSIVVDVPVRVDDLADASHRWLLSKFGHVVFIPTEFQVFDKATYFLNESGPAAHEHYKSRQIREVIGRLYPGRAAGDGE